MAIIATDNAYWLGKVPDDWGIARIGDYYKLRNEKVSDRDFPPLSVTMKGIVPQLATAAKTDDHDNRKLVRKGDFAINSRSDRRGSCGISDYDGSVSLINTVLTPRGEMNPKYYDWLFHTEQFADEFYKWGHGIVDDLWTTRWQEMKSILIVSPPLEEQQAIASYLDDRCSRLDEIITKAEKSIEEYKELKQAVIDNAITYGLNHHRELKQSDCEWVRTVPVGWRKIKLGWICSFHNGDRSNRYPSGDDFINEGIPFAGADSLNGTFVDRKKCRFIKHAHYESLSGLKIKINDILYTLRGSTIGKCAISDFNDGTVASSLTGIRVERLDDANPMFLLYWLQSICEFNQRTVLINGSTAPNLSAENVRQYKMFLPSRNEQNEIVRYLNEAVKKYDSIIVEKQETVQLLSEYKKSLIYEVVTGKKRVIV